MQLFSRSTKFVTDYLVLTLILGLSEITLTDFPLGKNSGNL